MGTQEKATRSDGPERIALTPIRKRIGKRMLHSLQTAPHTLMAIEVDFEAIDAVRREEKQRFRNEVGVGLTYLPFVARAVSEALRLHPRVNATMEEGEMLVHPDLNLGLAVDLDFEGLLVPVVRSAQSKSLRELALELSHAAQQARERKLKPNDMAGGTFTITNAGGYGTLFTGAIINQPQVAILSTDGVRHKPVALPRDTGFEIGVHPIGVLALSFDHRAFDGAYAASFLAELKNQLETRDWMAEL